MFELRDYAHDITNNLLTGFAPPALESMINAVVSADGAHRRDADLLDELLGPVQVVHRRARPRCAHRQAGAHRRERRHRAALARDRLRDPAAVHLPARRRGADGRVRGVERLGSSAPTTSRRWASASIAGPRSSPRRSRAARPWSRPTRSTRRTTSAKARRSGTCWAGSRGSSPAWQVSRARPQGTRACAATRRPRHPPRSASSCR